jgi:hypothetical protein
MVSTIPSSYARKPSGFSLNKLHQDSPLINYPLSSSLANEKVLRTPSPALPQRRRELSPLAFGVEEWVEFFPKSTNKRINKQINE